MEGVKRIAQLLIPDVSASFQALIYISSSAVVLLPTRLFSAPLGGGTDTKRRAHATTPLCNSLSDADEDGSGDSYLACRRASGAGTLLARTEQQQQRILLHLPAARQAGRGDVVRLVDMGVDVALITVQVEIVTGIDCASKCYTSHLSFFFFFTLFFFVGRKTSEPTAKTKL